MNEFARIERPQSRLAKQRRNHGQHDVERNGAHADEGGCPRIFASVEGEDERLVEGGEDQSQDGEAQRFDGAGGVGGQEFAALVDEGDDRFPHHEERDRGGDDEDEHQAQPARQRGAEGVFIGVGGVAREGGQDGDGDRGDDEAQWELDQRRREVHPRDTAFART